MRQANDRQEQILAAAGRLFASRRFHEVTTDDIAREARVGKGTIYRHFKDKDDLFFRVSTHGFDDLCEQVAQLAASDKVFDDKLDLAVAQIASYFAGQRERLRAMTGSERGGLFKGPHRQRWMATRDKLIDALARVIARGADMGIVRSDVPPATLARLLLALMRSRAMEQANDPTYFGDVRFLLDFFRRGAAPAPPPPSATASTAPIGDSAHA